MSKISKGSRVVLSYYCMVTKRTVHNHGVVMNMKGVCKDGKYTPNVMANVLFDGRYDSQRIRTENLKLEK